MSIEAFSSFKLFSAIGLEQAKETCERFGRLRNVTEVRLNPDACTYLASPEVIPLHTDHPAVDLIAWYCHAQDAVGGESILVDGLALAADMPDDYRTALKATLLPCPSLFGLNPESKFRLYNPRDGRIFYAPWLAKDLPPASAEAVADFDCRITHPENQVVLRLRPGDMLLVDNRRMLHGRPAIPSHSRRWLTRFWIELR